ncbi:MAG: hypothetical protein P9L88_06760 [Candidatus Tantalella remota]|nr:hypothetical protein [Candidatus Tantalella remota]
MTDTGDIKREIEILAELQEIDTEMFDLNSRKDEIPVRLKEMDDSLEARMGGMKGAEDKLKTLQVSKNEKENEMKSMEEKVVKHQGDLYQIKNNKEYQALQKEIDGINADISLTEEKIINLFDEIEGAQAVLEEEKKIFEQEKQDVEKEKNNIKEEAKKLENRLKELSAGRQELAGTVEDNILRQYDRILKNRGRVALVGINGEFCGDVTCRCVPR